MDSSNIILRVKKTIYYVDKILVNFPRNEAVLKKRISNSFFDILEYSYQALIDLDHRCQLIKDVLTKMKMIDFYLKISFDKGVLSHKGLKTLGVNLREITELYYAWLRKNEKKE